MHPSILVMGAAYTDYVARGPSLPRSGGDVRGDAFLELPGGKGLNQAVAAARLGAQVRFIGCVGADTRGDALVASLTAEGIDTSLVVRSSEVPTGAALIHVDEYANKQILVVPGANACLTARGLASAVSARSIERTMLVQQEVPFEAVEAAVVLASGAGPRVLLDPAPPRDLPGSLLTMVDILKPDAHEAEALTGIPVHDRASAQRAADRLMKRGARMVAVQAGREGNLLVSGDESYFVASIPVDAVDATGAGDAFAATLAVWLSDGFSIEESARFANAAAALATTKLGAYPSLPYHEAVENLVANTYDR